MANADLWLIAVLVVKAAFYFVCLFAAGSVFFVVATPVVRLNEMPLSLIGYACLTGLVLMVLLILAQVGRLMDDGLMGALERDVIALLLAGPAGRAASLCTGGLVLVWLGVFYPAVFRFVSGCGAFLVVASFSAVGHMTSDHSGVSSALLIMHLLCVGYWLGALVPLYRVAAHDPPRMALLAGAFSRRAVFFVLVLLGAGLAVAYRLTGGALAVFSSVYGQFLIVKISLVGLLLVLAMANKWHFFPRILAGKPEAASRFQRMIGVELIVFCLVFMLTALLTVALELPLELPGGH